MRASWTCSRRSVLVAATWWSSSTIRYGRFTSKRRCQCGCRMLADLSGGSPTCRSLFNFVLADHVFGLEPGLLRQTVLTTCLRPVATCSAACFPSCALSVCWSTLAVEAATFCMNILIQDCLLY